MPPPRTEEKPKAPAAPRAPPMPKCAALRQTCSFLADKAVPFPLGAASRCLHVSAPCDYAQDRFTRTVIVLVAPRHAYRAHVKHGTTRLYTPLLPSKSAYQPAPRHMASASCGNPPVAEVQMLLRKARLPRQPCKPCFCEGISPIIIQGINSHEPMARPVASFEMLPLLLPGSRCSRWSCRRTRGRRCAWPRCAACWRPAAPAWPPCATRRWRTSCARRANRHNRTVVKLIPRTTDVPCCARARWHAPHLLRSSASEQARGSAPS